MDPIIKEQTLFWASLFVPFNGQTSILRKIEGGKVFNAKSKHQYHVSQWGESVYSAQSQKELILLKESIFAYLMDKHWFQGK